MFFLFRMNFLTSMNRAPSNRPHLELTADKKPHIEMQDKDGADAFLRVLNNVSDLTQRLCPESEPLMRHKQQKSLENRNILPPTNRCVISCCS